MFGKVETAPIFLISNFRRVLNVVRFLLGDSPASEIYMPTFRNTLFHLHRQVGRLSAYEEHSTGERFDTAEPY